MSDNPQPAPIASLCVYCGAAPGSGKAFVEAAAQLGTLAAQQGTTIVYGGGGTGMMGALADGAMAAKGKVIGVITHSLVTRELAHPRVADMRVVDSMHQRKMVMADLSHAFVALPGGYGTLDELFECIAWAQLGIHTRPIGLLNVDGFFDDLIEFLRNAQRKAFLRLRLQDALVIEETPEDMLEALADCAAYPLAAPTSAR
ncbi:MAG: TIGR00730 family Rossman fold protein [Planctomycetota bacterium]